MKNINHRQHFWESTTVNNKSYTNLENSNTRHREPNEKGPTKGRNTHHVLGKNKKDNQTASAEITTQVSSARENPSVSCKTVRGEKLSGEKKKNNKKVKNDTLNLRLTADIRGKNAKGDTLVPLKEKGEREKFLEKRECLLNWESTKFHEKTDIENDASDFSNLIPFDDQPTVSENIPVRSNPPHGTHRDALTRDGLDDLLKNVHFDIHLDAHAETVLGGRAAPNGSINGSRDGGRNTEHGPTKNGGDGKNPPRGNNAAKTNFAKWNKEEKAERELLLEHIKRLEYQNNIFLNNLLNVYYVCMDYIKMQDEKIKKKEEIILLQNKIIKDLKASEHLEDTTGMSNDTTGNCRNDDSDL